MLLRASHTLQTDQRAPWTNRDVSVRMSENHFTRTRSQRRNGKVKCWQSFFPCPLLPPSSFPLFVILRVVFICASRQMTIPFLTLQSCDNDSFGRVPFYCCQSRESKTNRRNFTAVKSGTIVCFVISNT